MWSPFKSSLCGSRSVFGKYITISAQICYLCPTLKVSQFHTLLNVYVCLENWPRVSYHCRGFAVSRTIDISFTTRRQDLFHHFEFRQNLSTIYTTKNIVCSLFLTLFLIVLQCSLFRRKSLVKAFYFPVKPVYFPSPCGLVCFSVCVLLWAIIHHRHIIPFLCLRTCSTGQILGYCTVIYFHPQLLPESVSMALLL